MTEHHGTESPAASPQLIRRLNARKVLDHLWSGEPHTATDLMELTGLTRTTVLALCRTLLDLGWLQTLKDSRQVGQYSKGRPALRYALRSDARFVVGIDAGRHRITASVTDLQGQLVGFAQREAEPRADGDHWITAEQRRDRVTETVSAALSDAELTPDRVGIAVIGVPAPVNAEGDSPAGNRNFWEAMNPHQLLSIGAEHGWNCLLENDANLAALAELADKTAEERAPASYAVLLSGERMGAGLILQDSLLRQRRGGAGEMGFLNLVSGVESPEGMGWWARTLGQLAVTNKEYPTSTLADAKTSSISAEDVLEAAAAMDPLGVAVAEQLADKLARICAVLVGLLDLDRIIVSGAVAAGLHKAGVISAAAQRLPHYIYAPWLTLTASTLGADSVWRGAVHMGIEEVRRHAMEIPATSTQG